MEGSKTWNDAQDQDGKRPSSITIRLLANGEEVATRTVTAADEWQWSFTGLDKYAAGKEIKYTITEDAVQDYSTEVKGYNVENSYTPGKVSVSGSKIWNDNDNQDGIRPASIVVNLLANDEQVDSLTVTADENGSWSYTFADLDEYKNGKKINYSVT